MVGEHADPTEFWCQLIDAMGPHATECLRTSSMRLMQARQCISCAIPHYDDPEYITIHSQTFL